MLKNLDIAGIGDNMRYLFNLLLLFSGGIFVISTGGLIAMILPIRGSIPFSFPEDLVFAAIWISSVFALSNAYKMRTNWLLKTGIFKSWMNFKSVATYPTRNFPRVSSTDESALAKYFNLECEIKYTIHNTKMI